MEAIKVGDVVAWRDVPNGALVRVQQERYESLWLRLDREVGFQVGFMLGIYAPSVRLIWPAVCPRDPADRRRAAKATIIALSVPADATAEDLRVLAERFEIVERRGVHLRGVTMKTDTCRACGSTPPSLQRYACARCGRQTPEAERNEMLFGSDLLHRAGFRPREHTAEDAARLLTAQEAR